MNVSSVSKAGKRFPSKSNPMTAKELHPTEGT